MVDADTFEKAMNAANQLLASGNIPDGIFTTNDLTAIGAMQALQKKGVKIPAQIAIVGFSDGRFSGIIEPNLTSVDQHGYEMGSVATEMLLNRLLNPDTTFAPQTRVLNANLIVRDSSV